MRISNQAGDTIIEVLLAITIFSLVAVGAVTIMNQGTNAAQRSIEITLVRQQIDAQAEALRAAQQAYAINPTSAITWQNIKARSNSGHYNQPNSCPTAIADSGMRDTFILDARSAKTVGGANWFKSIDSSTLPYAQVDYNTSPVTSYGLWIEQEHKLGTNQAPDAYNFTIRSCWYGAGTGTTPMTLETIVRLYDPS